MTTESPQRLKVGRVALGGFLPVEIAESAGLKAYQGTQIFEWIHKKGALEFDEMTNVSKRLRRDLAEIFAIRELQLVEQSQSAQSDTRKVLLRLADGETVEAVRIPGRDRVTFCLSTQVGCPLKCAFCATGLSGFTRNLRTSEIVEQALYLMAIGDNESRSPNIVIMGMGEPLRNYDATMGALRILMAKEGLNIGARKITVSTAGEAPAIRRFASEGWQVRLSVSLHAATNKLRNDLVPLNKRYPIEELTDAVREYNEKTGRQITFEWTLLRGINDGVEQAEKLAAIARPLKSIVNLIPYNPVPELDYSAPNGVTCVSFRDALTARGVKATLRSERGGDINAACGQLRRRSVTT